jgi:acyl-CoA synthetase (NDP forming)
MADICASTLSEPSITGYVLFLEHLRDADRLRRFAAEARSQGKSVVAYKLGRTAEAAKLSVSHTGAMVGEDQFAATFLRESGIARIHHIDALPEAVTLARVLGDIPQQRTVSLAVVGTTGGGSAMLVDEMALRGVHVSRLSASSVQDLSQSGIRYGDGSVLDLTLAGTKAEVMSRALDVVAGSGDFDLVLVVLGSSAHSRPQATVAPVIEAFQKASCAIAVLVMPHAPEALALLLAAGVPAFNAPEVCADAIQAVFKARYRDRPENPLAIPARRRPEELLDAIGIARPPEVLASWDTEEPLALPFDYPVVMKVYGEGLLHKTDVGGVVLGIATPYEAAQVLAQWKASEVFDGKEVRIQIQPMVRGVVAEVLVGFLRDREVGPVVTVAMGGILAELSEQRVLRLAPVSVAEAREMISELAPLKVLDGYRGKPRGDREALAEAIAALSRLAACREVVEAEINPLMVLAEGKGVAAVDVLVQGK